MANSLDRGRAMVGVVATALSLLPFGGYAQTPPAGASATAPAEAAIAAPIDPARLAAARIAVDHIFPPGTYAKVWSGSMDKLMGSMAGNMVQMPLGEIAAIGGATPQDVAKMPKATIEAIMVIVDPAFHDRVAVAMHVVLDEMRGLMTQVEPDIRDGLVHAYASRFSIEQLNDLNRFFATPSGEAYASNAVLIQMDPAVTAKMQAFVPLMMKLLPAIRIKAEAATATLPMPRKWADLTPVERSKLAQLFGVSEAELAKKAGASATAK